MLSAETVLKVTEDVHGIMDALGSQSTEEPQKLVFALVQSQMELVQIIAYIMVNEIPPEHAFIKQQWQKILDDAKTQCLLANAMMPAISKDE